jgi:phosphate/sulfate permease
LARGLASLNFDIIKMIAISWISTIPFTAIISMMCYKAFLVFLP